MRYMDVDELLKMESSKALDKMENGKGADVQVVQHAKWTLADNFSDSAVCSFCNRLSHGFGNYCPHCGARMDGE